MQQTPFTNLRISAPSGPLGGRMGFPVLGNKFPVFPRTNPCLIPSENFAKDAEVPRYLEQRRRRDGPAFANFPVFFPVSREFGEETGSHWNASSASQPASQCGLCVEFPHGGNVRDLPCVSV
jgi:hypothetical protein